MHIFIVFLTLIMNIIFIHSVVAQQKPEFQAGIYLNKFGNYIEQVRDNCDFNKLFPREMLLDLSPTTQAACNAMLKDMERVGASVRRFDVVAKCDQQREMTVKECEDNLALCKRRYGELRHVVENCRSKIRVDSQTLKYKKE